VNAVEQIYKELGRRIAIARGEANMTQERLAGAIGLSRTSVVNVEAGRQRLSIHQLYRIADALDRQPSEFLPPSPDLDEEDRMAEWVTKVTRKEGQAV
jgi:transcriptional regulator with XRE-family HTH domain